MEIPLIFNWEGEEKFFKKKEYPGSDTIYSVFSNSIWKGNANLYSFKYICT